MACSSIFRIYLLYLFISSCISIPQKKVLLLHSVVANTPSFVDDVASKLSPYFQISTWQANSFTPSYENLTKWDAVFVFSDVSLKDPVELGNSLAEYVDHGYGVLCGMFDYVSSVPGETIQGRFINYQAIIPGYERSGSENGMKVIQKDHPIMKGVKSFLGGKSSYRGGSFHPLAQQIATWTDGMPLVATRMISNTRRVDLGFYPPSSDARSDFWNSTTDGVTLMVNSLNWLTETSCSYNRWNDCETCTSNKCQFCLDTSQCTPTNLTCSNRVVKKSECPINCNSFDLCSTCLNKSNDGACSWCLDSNSCVSQLHSSKCKGVINSDKYCNFERKLF